MRRVINSLIVAGVVAAGVGGALASSNESRPPVVSAGRRASALPQFCASDIELAFDPQLDDAALIQAVADVVRVPASNASVIRAPIKAVRTDVENNVACLTIDANADPVAVAELIDEIGTGTAVQHVRVR